MFGYIFEDALSSGASLIIILMLVSLAALISERAGVVNIGLEGQMVFAAFGYSLVTYKNYSGDNLSNHNLAATAIIVGIIFGILASFLHSLMILKFKINHIISGTVINVAAPSLAAIGATWLNGNANIADRIQYIPFKMGEFPLYPVILLLGVIFVVVILNFSKFGLRLKSVGENPWASASAGINPVQYKFLAITIAGALAGLSGSLYVIVRNIFMPTAGGYGFLAIAIMILARWNGWGVIVSSIILGYIIQLTFEVTAVKEVIKHIKPTLLRSIIYLLPLVSLVVFSFIYRRKMAGAPQALGINYSPH